MHTGEVGDIEIYFGRAQFRNKKCNLLELLATKNADIASQVLDIYQQLPVEHQRGAIPSRIRTKTTSGIQTQPFQLPIIENPYEGIPSNMPGLNPYAGVPTRNN